MENFNLIVRLRVLGMSLRAYCCPVKRGSERRMMICFTANSGFRSLELGNLIHRRLIASGRELDFREVDSESAIETSFPNFERLVLFLKGMDLECFDNRGEPIEIRFEEDSPVSIC